MDVLAKLIDINANVPAFPCSPRVELNSHTRPKISFPVILEICGEFTYQIENFPYTSLETSYLPSPPKDTARPLIPLPGDFAMDSRGSSPDETNSSASLADLEIFEDGDAIWTSPPRRRRWAQLMEEEEKVCGLGKMIEAEGDKPATPLREVRFPQKQQLASANKSPGLPVYRYVGEDCRLNYLVAKELLAKSPVKSILKSPSSVFHSSAPQKNVLSEEKKVVIEKSALKEITPSVYHDRDSEMPCCSRSFLDAELKAVASPPASPVRLQEVSSHVSVKSSSPVKDAFPKKIVRLSAVELQASVDRLSVPKRKRRFRPDPTPFALNQGKENTLRGWMKEPTSPLEEQTARRRLFVESPDMKAAFGNSTKNPPRKVLGELTSNIPVPTGHCRLR